MNLIYKQIVLFNGFQYRAITGALLGSLTLAVLASGMVSFEYNMGGLVSQVLSVPRRRYSLISNK